MIRQMNLFYKKIVFSIGLEDVPLKNYLLYFPLMKLFLSVSKTNSFTLNAKLQMVFVWIFFVFANYLLAATSSNLLST